MYSEAKLSVPQSYKKADEILTIAAKSIAEIITMELIQNVDFADVNTTMREGGIALMSNGYGEGDSRLQVAIEEALNSPLLSNNDIFNARRVLFCIYFSHDAELGMDEMSDIHNFMETILAFGRSRRLFGQSGSALGRAGASYRTFSVSDACQRERTVPAARVGAGQQRMERTFPFRDDMVARRSLWALEPHGRCHRRQLPHIQDAGEEWHQCVHERKEAEH